MGLWWLGLVKVIGLWFRLFLAARLIVYRLGSMRKGTPVTDSCFVWVSLGLQRSTINKTTYLSALSRLGLSNGAELNECKDVHLVSCKIKLVNITESADKELANE